MKPTVIDLFAGIGGLSLAINSGTKAVVATGSREGIDGLFRQVFARRDLSKPFFITGEADNVE